MKRTKFLLYEIKKLLFVPSIAFVTYLVVAFFQILSLLRGNTNAANLVKMDEKAEKALYVFFVVTVAWFSYRVFADRKLYAKVRICPHTLFLYRLALLVSVNILFVVIELLLGTARMAIWRKADMQAVMQFDRVCTFCLQGKNGWYLLFGVSVAMSAAVLYSATNFIANVLYSGERRQVKVLWIVVFLFGFSTAMTMLGLFTESTVNFGGLYGIPLPVNANSYQQYTAYYNAHTLDSITLTAGRLEILICHVAWDISNIPTCISGLVLTALGFFSETFFTRKHSEDYLYKHNRNKKGNREVK